MDFLKTTSLLHWPSRTYFEAGIVLLTDEVVEAELENRWWKDADLKDPFDPMPIDRYWNWTHAAIDYRGRMLSAQNFGIFAGDRLQGVLMISLEPIPSKIEPGKQALFVERVFTAPWNRRDLRKDGQDFVKAVGLELLTWGGIFEPRKGV